MRHSDRALQHPSRSFLGRQSLFLFCLAGLLVVWFGQENGLWTGLIVLTVGHSIQIWAAGSLTKNRTLSASGPYAIVRHPMYAGRFLVGLGLGLIIGRLWLLPFYVVLFFIYAVRRTNQEEDRLRERFGDKYATFCHCVPRWLPRIRSIRSLRGGSFEWERVGENGQWRAALGLAAIAVLVVARVYWFS